MKNKQHEKSILNEIKKFLAHENSLQRMFQDPVEWCKKTQLCSYFLYNQF